MGTYSNHISYVNDGVRFFGRHGKSHSLYEFVVPLSISGRDSARKFVGSLLFAQKHRFWLKTIDCQSPETSKPRFLESYSLAVSFLSSRSIWFRTREVVSYDYQSISEWGKKNFTISWKPKEMMSGLSVLCSAFLRNSKFSIVPTRS